MSDHDRAIGSPPDGDLGVADREGETDDGGVEGDEVRGDKLRSVGRGHSILLWGRRDGVTLYLHRLTAPKGCGREAYPESPLTFYDPLSYAQEAPILPYE